MAKDPQKQKRLDAKRRKKEAKRKALAKDRARLKQMDAELPSLLRRADPVKLWDQSTGLGGLASMLELDLRAAGRLADEYIAEGRIHADLRVWTPQRVRDLPFDALLEALKAHAADVDRERFCEAAKTFRSAATLSRTHWPHELALPTTRDLYELAADRLWREWIPERACAEELDDLYDLWATLHEEVGFTAACEAWALLWQRAWTTVTEEDHDLVAWSADWDPRGSLEYDISTCCDAAAAAPTEPHARAAVELATRILDQFPFPADIHRMLLDSWVEAKRALGEGEEADARRAKFEAENPQVIEPLPPES